MTEPVRLKFCFGSMDAIQTNDWGCPSCDSRKQCFEKTKSRMEQQKMKANHDQPEPTAENKELPCSEYTGGSVSYYKVRIGAPLSGNDAYVAECNDIIEALGMNYAEGNAFKGIWRMCAARTLGKQKKGYTDGLYDAEKVAFFGARMVEQQRRAQK